MQIRHTQLVSSSENLMLSEQPDSTRSWLSLRGTTRSHLSSATDFCGCNRSVADFCVRRGRKQLAIHHGVNEDLSFLRTSRLAGALPPGSGVAAHLGGHSAG